MNISEKLHWIQSGYAFVHVNTGAIDYFVVYDEEEVDPTESLLEYGDTKFFYTSVELNEATIEHGALYINNEKFNRLIEG
jgi:hypothetical protein